MLLRRPALEMGSDRTGAKRSMIPSGTTELFAESRSSRGCPGTHGVLCAIDDSMNAFVGDRVDASNGATRVQPSAVRWKRSTVAATGTEQLPLQGRGSGPLDGPSPHDRWDATAPESHIVSIDWDSAAILPTSMTP
jgi:hypothetical protein